MKNQLSGAVSAVGAVVAIAAIAFAVWLIVAL